MALGGINRATAYKLNAAGKLRLVKVAGRTFIPDDEVDRVAREGTEPSTQP
jgi:predicted site-specific integrase-resolvase